MTLPPARGPPNAFPYRDWMSSVADADRVADLARRVVADHDPKKVPIPEYLAACYDAGLSWVHFPEGLGGLGCHVVCRPWPTASSRVQAVPSR